MIQSTLDKCVCSNSRMTLSPGDSLIKPWIPFCSRSYTVQKIWVRPIVRVYCKTLGSICSMLRRRLQNGQLMFSQPHCTVELLGALTKFTVSGPRHWQSLLAYSVSSSWCPDLKENIKSRAFVVTLTQNHWIKHLC